MAGRPSLLTPEMANRICMEIATTSKSLRSICKPDDMPDVSTVLYWLSYAVKENAEERYVLFLDQYTRAKQEQADLLVEEMMEISDDSSNDTTHGQFGPIENKEWTSRSKLRVETRKWIASKLKPKKYGDKLDVTSGGEKLPTIQFEIIPPKTDDEV